MALLPQSPFQHVLQAAQGMQALHIAAEYRPESAILDTGLPGMNGYALAQRLRKDSRTAAIRLVVSTGYRFENDHIRALEAGFDRHFAKPRNYGT